MTFQDPYADIQQIVLPNGLSLYIKEYSHVSWFYAGVVVHAGAREDPAGREGLAHLVEHLVGENVSPLTFSQMKQQIEHLGGQGWFGTTSYLSTTYGFHFPAEEQSIQHAFRLYGHMLVQANLQQNIAEEKAVILREYHQTYMHELARTWALQGRTSLFERHPRLRSFVSADGIPGEFMESTQNEIQSFYDRYYVPENMSLVCLGQLKTQMILKLLQETAFLAQKPGERNIFPAPFEVHPPQTNSCQINLSQFSSLARSDAMCTFEWVLPLGFERQCVRIFSNMLETQLMNELRHQNRLTYAVTVDYSYYQDCRTFRVFFEVTPETLALAQDIFWQVLQAMPQAEESFRETKESILASIRRMDYSGYDLLQGIMDDLETHQRPIPFVEDLQQIEQTRFSHILALAEYLTPERGFRFILHP